jgi:mannose-6-phosphate isomerase-like protein (cupin superfamily)
MRTHYDDIPAYKTRDGSLIRELMHPATHGNRLQSLAEATVAVGARTLLHRHHRTEEIYHVTNGGGVMQLGKEEFAVVRGDTVCIAPGTAHAIRNTGDTPLVLMCCCTPSYDHDDTELLEPGTP